MVANRLQALELLNDLEKVNINGSTVSTGLSWYENIIAKLAKEHLFMSFSEYATYGSWLVTKYQGNAYIKPRKTWVRDLEWSLPEQIKAREGGNATANDKEVLCCPTERDYNKFYIKQKYKVNYAGVELGHVGSRYEVCHFKDPKYNVSYGVNVAGAPGPAT